MPFIEVIIKNKMSKKRKDYQPFIMLPIMWQVRTNYKNRELDKKAVKNT